MKNDVEIAKEVIEGKWGIGKEREKRIKEAGYDYNLIQGMVNRMVETGLPIESININSSKCCGIVVYIET